jgi:hypothetical protein
MSEEQVLTVEDMLEELEELLEEDSDGSGLFEKDIEFLRDTLEFVEDGEEMTLDQKRKVEELWRSCYI